jgi:hypothetical protein
MKKLYDLKINCQAQLDKAVELIIDIIENDNISIQVTKKLNEAITLINGD